MKTSIVRVILIVTAVGLLSFFGVNAEADDFNRTNLPIPDQPFKGKTGLRPEDSVKDFLKEVTAPEGAPNIFLILTDDIRGESPVAFL
jgi:arylsulfatase